MELSAVFDHSSPAQSSSTRDNLTRFPSSPLHVPSFECFCPDALTNAPIADWSLRSTPPSRSFISDLSPAQSSPTHASAPRGALSPASTTSNVSSFRDHHRLSDFANYRRDLAVLETSGGRLPSIQQQPPTANPSSTSQVAPWMSPSNGGATASTPQSQLNTTFYNDSSDNLSIASQLSPGFRPPTNRIAPQSSGSQDSPDAAYFGDERRPSLASITTLSSQGSKTSIRRGGLQKLQGFFGEEFPGRDGSESSLHSSSGKDRSRSYSHSRPTRDRNYSNATDHQRDREGSPSSSRPRTPVPAPEVVPFLYQEADVSKIHASASSCCCFVFV